MAEEVRARLQREDGVRFTLQDALDGGRGVEARGYGAAEGFDAGDGRGRCAGDDDVDCGFQLISVLEMRRALVRWTIVEDEVRWRHTCGAGLGMCYSGYLGSTKGGA